MNQPQTAQDLLLNDLRSLIAQARQRVATTINSEITRLYWAIGKRIYQEILQQERAEYGQGTIRLLSERLTTEFGKGFTKTNLTNAIELARLYPNPDIIHALSEQLT